MSDHGAEEIAEGVSAGLSRSRTALNDRRLLVIYLLLVAYVAFFTWRSDVQQRAVYHNCISVAAGNGRFNALLDQQITNVNNSKALTESQKQEARDFYRRAHLEVTKCSKPDWL